MSTPCRCEPMGKKEIAEMLGVQVETTYAWTKRGSWPEPDYLSVNSHPAWERSTIIRWAAERGTLPDHLRDELAAILAADPAEPEQVPG